MEHAPVAPKLRPLADTVRTVAVPRRRGVAHRQHCRLRPGPDYRDEPSSGVPRTTHFARSRYSPVLGFTRIFSPDEMNSGTFTVAPFASLAGL